MRMFTALIVGSHMGQPQNRQKPGKKSRKKRRPWMPHFEGFRAGRTGYESKPRKWHEGDLIGGKHSGPRLTDDVCRRADRIKSILTKNPVGMTTSELIKATGFGIIGVRNAVNALTYISDLGEEETSEGPRFFLLSAKLKHHEEIIQNWERGWKKRQREIRLEKVHKNP
jgi:predicted heme/steroid binding protein